MNPLYADQSPESYDVLHLAYGSEPSQFGDLYVPRVPGSDLAVILIHGGFWRARYGLDFMQDLARNLAMRGIAAWNIEYRRLGEAGGGWPATLLDVASAADYLQSVASVYALNMQRVVTLGHSAGGHLALWLAARYRISPASVLCPAWPEPGTLHSQDTHRPLVPIGAISLAGALDLELCWQLNLSNGAVAALLGGSPGGVPERYAAASPAALLPLGVPQVLIHGTVDDSVPLQVSQIYARKATEAGDQVTLIELAETDHFALINARSSAWRRTVEALHSFD